VVLHLSGKLYGDIDLFKLLDEVRRVLRGAYAVREPALS